MSARNTSSRSTLLSSAGTLSAKEGRPAWNGGISPGRASSFMKSNSSKALGEYKTLPNVRVHSEGSATKGDKLSIRTNPSPLRTESTGRVIKPSSPRLRPASPRLPGSAGKEDATPRVTRAVKNETPPPSRPKPASSFTTPPNKIRRPLATIGTPTNQSNDRSRTLNETPTRKLKERPSGSGVTQDSNGKEKVKTQPLSGWSFSSSKSRRGSTPGKGSTPNRAPVKSMFLSPQAAKKNVRKEPLRKSSENHGIWVGQVPSRKRAAEKREGENGMPPPAQPTSSPEIPKRGSKELSGEGIRGYFGAGPMVAPEGGFVRDRRKCKPRGTLVVGNEGSNPDSDSSGVLETSVQIPLPSVASVEWMEQKDLLGRPKSSSVVEYQPRASSQVSDEFFEYEFQPQVKQARTTGGERNPSKKHRQGGNENNENQSVYDTYGESLRHMLKQSRSSAGETQNELHYLGQGTDGFQGVQSSQDTVAPGLYAFGARTSAGEANTALRSLRRSGEGFYQPIVRSSQGFLHQLRQSQRKSKEGGKQPSWQAPQLSFEDNSSFQNSFLSEDTRHNLLYRDDQVKASSVFGAGTTDSIQLVNASAVSIDWRDGLRASGASSVKHSPEHWKGGNLQRSISFAPYLVPPPEERRMSGAAKTWDAPDSTWYGFSPITPELQRTSQEGIGLKSVDPVVAGSVRRRIMSEHASFDGSDSDLPSKSLVQSLQALSPNDVVSRLLQARSSQSRSSRSSRGSEETGSFTFATRKSYASIAELEADPDIETSETYMCETASPIEPLGDEGSSESGMVNMEFLCLEKAEVEIELHSESEDTICRTASPVNEVCSSSNHDADVCNWDEAVGKSGKWDDAMDCEDGDGVEYASPVAGDYLSPVKPPSQCASPERMQKNCTEANKVLRASQRLTSMNRTLEELLRHNLQI